MKNDVNSCHEMSNEEILNIEHTDFPLYHAILYGDKTLTAKFSKRLACAVKHLPVRVSFSYEHDTQKAIEAGVRKDPTLLLNGKIFLEGLTQAEIISKKFEELLFT